MRIIIAGGGAAGFFGAISAANQNPNAEIILLEATHKPLQKVRISGGGRCNVTHHCYEPAELVKGYPRGGRELLGPFTRFQAKDTVAWFEKQGVRLKTEEDGRMFPVTDVSETVVGCLLNSARKLGVKLWLGARVKGVRLTDSGQYEVELADGARHLCDKLLLATGSSLQGLKLAESLGHGIIPCVPSLFTFKITNPRLDGLSGISFENVSLTLTCDENQQLEQTGALLITHWGLSGPAVLKLSAWGARMLRQCDYHARLKANFLPDKNFERIHAELAAFREQNSRKKVQTDSPFRIPARYWHQMLKFVGIGEDTVWNQFTKTAMNAIVSELTGGIFEITGKGVFKEEFVTCGGVNLKEVDFKTMESKTSPGLFLAGEILDIDGITGGFNFQSAWTTGWIAGLSMANPGIQR
ncbi:MAG: NAD(P)/FAD-dependent oxidoreductase [candidate division Zixibacteria bacterium]|nr:NAD(P)/FAD-dependent oxidoreductase [candidate division Zixibacteria bacterium]